MKMQAKRQSPLFFTVHVEDFGKITKADVDLSPLTLFVGDNNSGKSYLLTLIYGLLSKYADELLLKGFETQYGAFLPLITLCSRPDRVNEHYFMTKEEIGMFTDIVNKTLESCKGDLIRAVFNKDIKIGRIRLTFHYDEAKPISLCFARFPDGKRHMIVGVSSNPQMMEIDDCFGEFVMSGSGHMIDISDQKNPKELTLLFMRSLFKKLTLHDNFPGPAFLPSCRTGFVLTYKALYADSLQKAYTIADQKTTSNILLTAPMIEFATRLGMFSSADSDMQERDGIVRFMEEKLLGGTIELSSMPVPDLLYRPRGTAETLSMHVASAVVTETAPLLLYLQKIAATCLLIEEPEMCLHPKLQQVMARVLIKTVNSGYYGVPVIASTHSDIIVQHVSNMLHLCLRPDRNRLMSESGYDEDDLLEPKDVHIYQFDDRGIHSEVTAVPWNVKNGFIINTFIDALDSILQNTIDITSED
jgi:energy-coupling factor transporter ATP-binding protein EcfA2